MINFYLLELKMKIMAILNKSDIKTVLLKLDEGYFILGVISMEFKVDHFKTLLFLWFSICFVYTCVPDSF